METVEKQVGTCSIRISALGCLTSTIIERMCKHYDYVLYLFKKRVK